MGKFHCLEKENNNYFITRKKPFLPLDSIEKNELEEIFEFSYSMTFGASGEHRAYRTGGSHVRKKGEIFANTFQGKLAEFALYNFFKNNKISTTKPDLKTYGLGKWDNVDLEVNSKKISIKSTKAFGNLLLLEEKDWNNKGIYLPNDTNYDFIVLLRVKPFCEEIMKKNNFLYSDLANKESLKNLILEENWKFDIPGFISLEELLEIINKNFIIEKGSLLNGKIKMDASNYYIQVGDMRDINNIIKNFV